MFQKQVTRYIKQVHYCQRKAYNDQSISRGYSYGSRQRSVWEGAPEIGFLILQYARAGIRGTEEELRSLRYHMSGLSFEDRTALEEQWIDLAWLYTAVEQEEQKKQGLISNSARAGIRGALDMLYLLHSNGVRFPSGQEIIERHRRWYELVSEYSRRALTRRSDKLVALSGLASRVQEKTGMRYYAGMWEPTLTHDLLWISTAPSGPGTSGYIAPSWSWASTDGRVESVLANHFLKEKNGKRPSLKINVHIGIEDIAVMVAGQRTADPVSLIDEGHITLRGPMKPVRLSDYSVTPDLVLEGCEDFICLATHSDSSRNITPYDIWWGLLLRPILDCRPNVYERCGIITGIETCNFTGGDGWEKKTLTIV